MTNQNIANISNNANTLPKEFSEISQLCIATDVVIGGQNVLGIADARNLHEGLGVGRDYTNWIKRRITRYGFVEKVDYEVFANFGENPLGGRPTNIYRITLDMAKELAMVENNEKGRLIRRYFIWCENQLRNQSKTLSPIQYGGITKSVVNKAVAILRKDFEKVYRDVEFLKTGFDPSAAFVTYYKPIIAVLKEKNVPQKGRRTLSCRCSGRIHRYLIRMDKASMIQISRETGRYIYHIDGISEWLGYEGENIIRNHIDKVMGQGRLHLVPSTNNSFKH